MSGLLNTSPLGVVRRFEAAGFRAWPAGNVRYDGTWVIRLTDGHDAKRLNSVNPLDPGDERDLSARVERARLHFESFGKPFVFRMSPLAGRALADHFDSQGWSRYSESMVMMMPLDDGVLHHAMDHIPLRDIERFVASALKVHAMTPLMRPGLGNIIAAIEAEAGLFVLEREGTPLATAICVHDGELAGLFEIATGEAERRKGYGRRIVLSALKWARMWGARFAWLQVEADNEKALALYRSLGFTEAYQYHYRSPPERK